MMPADFFGWLKHYTTVRGQRRKGPAKKRRTGSTVHLDVEHLETRWLMTTVGLVTDVMVSEGGGHATLSIALNQPAPTTITVEFYTDDGNYTDPSGSLYTAVTPEDYTSTDTTVTFTPGSQTRTATVPIVDDNIEEYTQTFRVKLRNPTNATLGTDSALVSIIDNDGAPAVMFTSNHFDGSEASQQAVVSAKLDHPTQKHDVYVGYDTYDRCG